MEKYLPGASIIIAGNKYDMVNKNVDEQMALAYARGVGAEHILTSAKTGHNVNEIFS